MTVLCSVHFLLVRFFSFYARFDLNARVVLLHFRWRQFIHYCDWITHYTVFKAFFKEMNTGFERCIHNEFANKSKVWTWDTRWNASQSHCIYSQIHHIKGLWKMHSFYFLNKKERRKILSEVAPQHFDLQIFRFGIYADCLASMHVEFHWYIRKLNLKFRVLKR